MERQGEEAAKVVVRAVKSVVKYAIVGYVAKQALIACGKVND